MKQEKNVFAVQTSNGMAKIGKSTILVPAIKFDGKGIKWFDDKTLIRKK